MVREKVKNTDIGMIMFGERDGGVYLKAARYGKVCGVIPSIPSDHTTIVPIATPHYHLLPTVVIGM